MNYEKRSIQIVAGVERSERSEAIDFKRSTPGREDLVDVMKEFASVAYRSVAYVNFENNQMMRTLFETDFSIERILQAVEAVTGVRPDPNETLIIFDEIQEAPRGLTALKYFCENAPQYHLMAVGSLLGVALHQGSYRGQGRRKSSCKKPSLIYRSTS